MIAFVVLLIVLLVANIELYLVEDKAIFINKAPKTYYVLSAKDTGLTNPIYIYNKKNVKFRDIPKHPGFNSDNYQKTEINEHVASKFNTKLRDFGKLVLHLPTSSIPIQKLYNTISKGQEFMMLKDNVTIDESNVKIVYPKDDNIEFFTVGDKIYVIND